MRKLIAGGAVEEPVDGESIRLTIDLLMQTILEEELALGVVTSKSVWGTAIAMNPKTGAILALANYPTYDPNAPGDFPTAYRRNHAVTDRIEPGSTMKLIAAVAALESGIVDLADSVETGPGWMVQYGRTLKDTHPYGTITFADVLKLSSNVGTAKVAERLDRGVFYQYARNFGFGQRTFVDLPGEVDLVLKRPSRWSRPTVSAMSRGYEINATPLQVLAAYAAFANGGVLMRPYVVQERIDASGQVTWRQEPQAIRRVFEPETAERLLPTFESVVTDGTATEAHIDGLRIAGKTGTAKKVIDGTYAVGAYRASFVGFFPADDPEVVLIVVMDEPESSIYGGSVAAPVFRRTVERWLPRMPEIATERMERLAGLGQESHDETAPEDQPDERAEPTPVRFASLDGAADGVMPDLKGLGLRTAIAELAARGVIARID
ncbi:MAG: penicillin-binding protein 2, partial [Rhodothermales bacterium]|nr:penicillin-binding protein 2 [Rhodothermales bacterium]